MARRLDGLRGCVLAAEGVEDLEYYVTMMRLQEEGVAVDTVALSLGAFRGKNGLEVVPDTTVEQAVGIAYDVVVLPGGWAPDKLRRSPQVLEIIRSRYAAGAVIAAICHGPWLLASADLVRGRRATGSLGIKDDLVNAGAEWVDESAFTDGQLVWGRVVADIPNFCHELIERLGVYAETRRG